MNDIQIAKTISIREAGHDEYWLQKQIYDNPEILGLGDLESISKERQQASGGRLDMLLKDSTDDTMYEVEIQLGDTDESHIIRTIEYWDNEKRKWPKRTHYAVLVSESVTKRFFNVIHLFSHAIPIIAIQVNMLQHGDEKFLNFIKILDTYEEPEEPGGDEIYDEMFWRKKGSWVVDVVNSFQEAVGDLFEEVSLRFVKNYISIIIGGKRVFLFHRRARPKARLAFPVIEDQVEMVTNLFDEQNISYVQKRKNIILTFDVKFITEHRDLLRQVVAYVDAAHIRELKKRAKDDYEEGGENNANRSDN